MDSSAVPLAILKARFGYDSFRALQEEIIGNVLGRRDSLTPMPTGGGKSLCYQLPALIFDGITLVISLLIALMKDQVDALNANGIAARFINSSLPASAIEHVQAQVRRGQVKILYVAPERLALPAFRRFLHSLNLSLIAIDEAHCISEWGHEFRPDYRNLQQLRQDFPSVPVIALTATAAERVREDIIGQLGLQRGRVFLSSFNRANLSYSVQPKASSWGQLMSLLEQRLSQSIIIYCFSRQETEELARNLNARGLSARPYHAGLDPEVGPAKCAPRSEPGYPFQSPPPHQLPGKLRPRHTDVTIVAMRSPKPRWHRPPRNRRGPNEQGIDLLLPSRSGDGLGPPQFSSKLCTCICRCPRDQKLGLPAAPYTRPPELPCCSRCSSRAAAARLTGTPNPWSRFSELTRRQPPPRQPRLVPCPLHLQPPKSRRRLPLSWS